MRSLLRKRSRQMTPSEAECTSTKDGPSVCWSNTSHSCLEKSRSFRKRANLSNYPRPIGKSGVCMSPCTNLSSHAHLEEVLSWVPMTYTSAACSCEVGRRRSSRQGGRSCNLGKHSVSNCSLVPRLLPHF